MNPAAWLGLGAALVALSSFGLARPIRLTLYIVIAYVLLMQGPGLAGLFSRLADELGPKPSPALGPR